MTKNVDEKPFIRNPFISDVFEKIDRMRTQRKLYGDVRCLLITGESGSGKSELSIRYAQQYPCHELRYRTIIPVLRLEFKSVLNVKDLFVQLLIAIKDPQKGTGGNNVNDLLRRFVKLAKEVRLELIILDEVQTVIQRRSYSVLAGIGDKLKELIVEGFPIVFLGMPWSKYLFDASQQLGERVSSRMELSPYKLSDPSSLKNYASLVRFLMKHYHIQSQLKIPFNEMLIRIFGYTSGNLRRTSDLIRDVFVDASLTSKPISVESFAQVVQGYGRHNENNPFLLPIGDLKIYELTENSNWNPGARAGMNSIVQPKYTVYGVSPEYKLYKMAPT